MESLMSREAQEAPERCLAQFARNRVLMQEVGARLRALCPPFAATLARGSSDQAAAFAKVLFETRADTPTLSHAPSIGSLYGASSSRLRGVPMLAISQSGRSPDLIAATRDAQRQGAIVIALTNDSASPLADLADVAVPVGAGPETSVAATKSLICTLFALAHLTAEWARDEALLAALATGGPVLRAAAAADWTAAVPLFRDAGTMLVLGRGLTLPIAGEAALKLKETSNLHAEAFSIAEVAHGPMTLVGAGDPVLVFGPSDQAGEGLRDRIADFVGRGATVVAAGRPADVAQASLVLPTPASDHPVLAAIAQIQSFYGLADALAIARGRDPDRPPHLRKVTSTL